MSRYARKVDDNHGKVVEALRAQGATVQSLAAVGAGVPDLLVGYRGRTLLLEVKDGAKVPSKQRLTEAEADWHRDWRGGPLDTVSSPEEALSVLRGVAAMKGEA